MVFLISWVAGKFTEERLANSFIVTGVQLPCILNTCTQSTKRKWNNNQQQQRNAAVSTEKWNPPDRICCLKRMISRDITRRGVACVCGNLNYKRLNEVETGDSSFSCRINPKSSPSQYATRSIVYLLYTVWVLKLTTPVHKKKEVTTSGRHNVRDVRKVG